MSLSRFSALAVLVHVAATSPSLAESGWRVEYCTKRYCIVHKDIKSADLQDTGGISVVLQGPAAVFLHDDYRLIAASDMTMEDAIMNDAEPPSLPGHVSIFVDSRTPIEYSCDATRTFSKVSKEKWVFAGKEIVCSTGNNSEIVAAFRSGKQATVIVTFGEERWTFNFALKGFTAAWQAATAEANASAQ